MAARRQHRDRWRKKKGLSCGASDPAAIERGRKVYNFRCYFCHGYSGDARTEAAAVLDPRPRDFTAATDLDRARILAALRNGRPGTAMKSFATVISGQEIEEVARFVEEVFVACGDENTRYHTVENGWPDHQARYGPAFPFATGEIALDTPDDMLSDAERQGRVLFRTTCISCHDGRLTDPTPLAIMPAGTGRAGAAPGGHAEGGGHVDDYETPTIHDRAPEIADLSAAEERGRDLYTRACAQCHAADGSGMNWVGKFLQPNPPDFRTPEFAARFDPARFAASTLEASEGTTMPSFGEVLTTSEVADIAAYVARAFVGR